MSKSNLVKDIRTSATYKKFCRIVDTARERIQTDKDKAEALGLHAGRVSRRLYGDKQYSPKTLINAAQQDMAYRSRLVEMRVQCNLSTSRLDEGIDAIRSFISTEYSEDLKVFKTVGDRKAFIDRVVSSAMTLKTEGETLVELLDTLIKDIDATSHQMRQIVECLKLLDQSKGGKVV